MNYFLNRKIPSFGRLMTEKEEELWNRIECNANISGPWGYRIAKRDGGGKPYLFASNGKIATDYCRNGYAVQKPTQKMKLHYFAGKALWITSSVENYNSDGTCFVEALLDLDNKHLILDKDSTKQLAIEIASMLNIKPLLYKSTNETGYHIPFRIKLNHYINPEYIWLVMGKLQKMLNSIVQDVDNSLGLDVCGKPFFVQWKNGKIDGVKCSDNIVKLPDGLNHDEVFEKWLTRSVVDFQVLKEFVKDVEVQKTINDSVTTTPPTALVCLSTINKIGNSATVEQQHLNNLQKLYDLNPFETIVYKYYEGKKPKKLFINKEKFVAYSYAWISVAYMQDRDFDVMPERRSTVGVMAVRAMFDKLSTDWKISLKHSMNDQTVVGQMLLNIGVLAMINSGYRVGGVKHGKARQIKFLGGCLRNLVEEEKAIDFGIENLTVAANS